MSVIISARSERWPIDGTFRIARGAKTEAEVVVVEVREGELRGRGESVPYARYAETVDGVLGAIATVGGEAGEDREALGRVLPAGAARCAIDCALWELEAVQAGRPVWELAGVRRPRPVPTLRTVSIDAPEAMADAARRLAARQLKLKLAGDADDLARAEAVRAAAPRATIVADPNESWTAEHLERLGPRFVELGIAWVEQPLPAERDEVLKDLKVPGLAICADEAIHTSADLEARADRYDAINVKLDKAGGLTAALSLCRAARARGLSVMVGCMVCTSLAIAPAFLLSNEADVFDLDGPLLLARDRDGGAFLEDGLLHPPTLWGR